MWCRSIADEAWQEQRQRRFDLQPRVGAKRLPWEPIEKRINPNGVVPLCALGHNPLELARRIGFIPRVARASQPWAGGLNAFGVLHHI